MYNRFFAFGCSWTSWFWPTWSDIIAKDLNIEYENWGAPGSGNQGIQARFVEANNTYKFNQSDLVIVQWSGWNREDRFIDYNWKFGGNIFNNQYYDNKFIKRHWSYDNDLIKNSVVIKITNDAYLDKIKYQFAFGFPLVDKNVETNEYNNWFNSDYKTHKTPDIIKSYYNHLPTIDDPNFTNNRFNQQCMDTHPDVAAHIEIVEKYIYPNIFNKDCIKTETKDFFMSYSNELSTILSPKDSWDKMQNKATELNKKYNLNLSERRGV